MDRTSLSRRLADLLGPKGFTTDVGDFGTWLTDWRGRYHGAAWAMASPTGTEELAGLVTLCAEAGQPIVAQGGNSGMCGGATPDGSGDAVLLSLRRMNRVRAIDTEARLITVEAGVVLQNLHGEAAKYDLRFPLTLGGKGSATVGGLISTNAGGTQVLRHGTMRALVEGIEAVLPNGEVFSALRPLKKDNRGYDLRHLLIGAEGTLGVVAAATLRLVPQLIDRCVIWAGLDSPQAARKLLLHCQRRVPDALEGFEILPQRCLDNVLKHIPGTRAPLASSAPWHALIELVRDDADAPEPQALAEPLMADALEQGLARDAVLSMNEAQAQDFWKIRDSISEAERAEGPAMQHDISVPLAGMPDFITDAGSAIEREFPGTQALGFGHLGDGNIHFHIAAPGGVDPATWPDREGKTISRRVHDLVVAAGGSISAEHGIGQMKRDELARLSDPARIGALVAIKRALDPKGIMNPGKLIPLAPETQAT